MVDHVERDLGRGAVVKIVFEFVTDEVIRLHHLLQVATVEQTVVDLLANDRLKISCLILLEKHFHGVLCMIVIITSAETTHLGLFFLLFVLLIVLFSNDSLTLLVELN